MAEFSNTQGWRLVRPVEIREPAQEVNGKPKEFSLYLHPQLLFLELQDVVVRSAFRWREIYISGDENQEGRLERDRPDHRRYISATASLKHRIHVFRVDGPQVAVWDDQPISIEIYPDDRGEAATWARRVDGMSGDEMPDEGILVGEPGRLSYFGPQKPLTWHEEAQPAQLILSLYAPKTELEPLLKDLIRSPRQASKLLLSVEAELWEGEVERFFSEQTPVRDYGLLAKSSNSDHASTKARITFLTAEFEPVAQKPIPEEGVDLEDEPEARPALPPDPMAAMVRAVGMSSDRLRQTVRRCTVGMAMVIGLTAILISAS